MTVTSTYGAYYRKTRICILTFFDGNERHIKIMLLIILKTANLVSRSRNGGFFVSHPRMSAKDTKLSHTTSVTGTPSATAI